MSRKTSLLGVALLVGLLPLASAWTRPAPAVAEAAPSEAAAPPQPTLVRVGLPRSVSDAGVIIARARGLFRDVGLEVEIVPVQSAPETIAPMAAGDLEAAGGTLTTGLFNAVERGIGLRMVADKGHSRPGFEYSQIVVRRDLLDSGEIRDVGDLRGRRIAVASTRSGVESLVAQVLGRAGLTVADADLTLMGYPDGVVALGNRAVDAASTIEPLLSLGVAQGVSGTWEPGRSSAAYGGVYQAGTLVVSPRFGAQSEQVRRFLVAYLRGVRAYNDAFARGQGRDEMIRLLAEETNVRDAAAYERMQMAGLDPDGRIARQSLQIDLDYFRRMGYYTGPLTLDDVIDTSYVDYAVQQLGPYQ